MDQQQQAPKPPNRREVSQLIDFKIQWAARHRMPRPQINPVIVPPVGLRFVELLARFIEELTNTFPDKIAEILHLAQGGFPVGPPGQDGLGKLRRIRQLIEEAQEAWDEYDFERLRDRLQDAYECTLPGSGLDQLFRERGLSQEVYLEFIGEIQFMHDFIAGLIPSKHGLCYGARYV